MKTIFVALFLMTASAHAQEVSYFHGPATVISEKMKSFMVLTKVSHLPTGVSHSIFRYSTKDKTGVSMSVTLKKSGADWIVHADANTLPDADFIATITGPAQKPSVIVAKKKNTTNSKTTATMKIEQNEKNLDTELITTDISGKILNKVSTSQTRISQAEFEKIKSSLKLR